jgi:myo-inositol-1(or 4)-monophosphatase
LLRHEAAREHEGVEEAALELVLRLGRDAIAIARGEAAAVTTKRDVFDIVTSVDGAIEEHLRAEIRRQFFDHAILGEEGGLDIGSTEWRWVLDPIDGTFNFATRFGASACSIALMQDGHTAVAGIADFSGGIVYSARRGHGVFREGSPFHELERIEIGKSRLFLEFGTEQLDRDLSAVLGAFADALPSVPRLIGSAAVALLAVALHDGVFAGVGVRMWDVAAGVLLAEECGCVSQWLPGSNGDVHVLVGSQERVQAYESVMLEASELWHARRQAARNRDVS